MATPPWNQYGPGGVMQQVASIGTLGVVPTGTAGPTAGASRYGQYYANGGVMGQIGDAGTVPTGPTGTAAVWNQYYPGGVFGQIANASLVVPTGPQS